MTAFGGTTWGLIGVSAVVAAGLGILMVAWVTGRLTLDLGWGRSHQALGPYEIEIAAPRDVAFSTVAAPYVGRAPRDVRERLEVLDSAPGLVIAAHHTKLRGFTSTTVESVTLEEPDRIGFRVLRGVAPSVTEEFLFRQIDSGTILTYRGDLAMDLWVLGRVAGRLVKRTWERVVREHLDEVKTMAETRARASRRREDRS